MIPMKTTKKILAVILAVMMVVAMVPVAVSAATSTIASRADFVSAVKNGGEYTVTQSFEISDSTAIAVNSGVNLTIDFAGNTVTFKNAWTFENYGTLTLKDSVGNGGITTPKGAVDNYGTLTIDSGTYKATGTTLGKGSVLFNEKGSDKVITVNGGTFVSDYDVVINYAGATLNLNGGSFTSSKGGNAIDNDNGTVVVENASIKAAATAIYSVGGSVTINSGSLTSSDENAIFGQEAEIVINDGTVTSTSSSRAAIVAKAGSVTVNDGTVTGKFGGVYSYLYNMVPAEITINGGNITGETYNALYLDMYSNSQSYSFQVITVNGGVLNGDITDPSVNHYGVDYARVYITAGTFTTDVSIFLDGDSFIKEEDGKYIVLSKKTTQEVADDDEGAAKFELGLKKYSNIDLLGVQLRDDDDSALRFVSVINKDIIDSAVDYGYVLATSDKDAKTVRDNAGNLTFENGFKVSCAETSNELSGKYGEYDAETAYKYVTAAVTDVPAEKTVVARIYVEKADGVVVYGNYLQTYNGCAAKISDIKKG
jgi:hypothetical protein